MASPWHNLLSKVDRALVAYIVQYGAGTPDDVFPLKASGDKVVPGTTCISERGLETEPYSGTYTIHSSVEVRTQAALDVGQDAQQVRDLSERRVALTFDAFHSNVNSAGDQLGADITAVGRATNQADLQDLTILNVSVRSVEAGFDEHYDGSVWVDRINLEIIACPSNVS